MILISTRYFSSPYFKPVHSDEMTSNNKSNNSNSSVVFQSALVAMLTLVLVFIVVVVARAALKSWPGLRFRTRQLRHAWLRARGQM